MIRIRNFAKFLSLEDHHIILQTQDMPSQTAV